MKPRSHFLLLLLIVVVFAGCQSTKYADRGAAAGAITGALAGAAIGNHNGDTAAGAIIGTMVGTLTGAAIGDSIDTEIAKNNAMIEQRIGRQLAGAVSVDDVMTLSRAQLSDEVIITHIRGNGVAQPPRPEDLIALTQCGVSDAVINALQTTPPPLPPNPPPVAPPARVVVEEYHYGPRPPWYHRHGPRSGRNSFHWGVSLGR